MVWDEVDIEAALWTVPADRMKAGREHRVPLSRQAVQLLKAQPRGGARFPIQSHGRTFRYGAHYAYEATQGGRCAPWVPFYLPGLGR